MVQLIAIQSRKLHKDKYRWHVTTKKYVYVSIKLKFIR